MKRNILIIMLVIVLSFSFTTVIANANTMTITSKEGVLMSENGEVLYQHNGTDKRPIASMTKIMTLLCIYEEVDNGALSLDDDIIVSSNASSMGGSQVFLDANTTHKARDLIKSIIVCSANDSCVAMAEHISGSVDSFVAKMNSRASSMGLVATNFANCTGLPIASQYSCAVDVANMTRKLVQYQHYGDCAKIWMEDYVHPDGRTTSMTNTNKLIRFYDGCDGGKTGFTNEAMHCLSATARRGDTRMFAVIIGANDSKTRFAEVSNLLNYGFANYESKVLLDPNSVLDGVPVIGGKCSLVTPIVNDQLITFARKGQLAGEVVLEYKQLCAPIEAGEVIGKASIVVGDNIVTSCDIVAKESVLAKSYWDYLMQSVY